MFLRFRQKSSSLDSSYFLEGLFYSLTGVGINNWYTTDLHRACLILEIKI